MPALQTVDLSPRERTEETSLEKILGGFSKQNRANQVEQKESDALKGIYGEYQNDGQNLQKAIQRIQTTPGISPTSRVNTIDQLLLFQKHNTDMQKVQQKTIDKQTKEDNNRKILADIEKKRDLEPGSLDAYVNDVKTAEVSTRLVKATKEAQVDRPTSDEQLKKMKTVEDSPKFKDATIQQKGQLYTRGGVSNPNTKLATDRLYEEEKNLTDKAKVDKELEYKYHKESEDYEQELEKASKSAKIQLDAIETSEKAVKSGAIKPSSLASIFRGMGTVGDKISNALLNNKEAELQANIPAFLEGKKELFGVRLSDADLRLLQDKLPDIGKSKEANLAILRLMKKYSKNSILKEKIGSQVRTENKGLRPLQYRNKVEDRFDEMIKPVKIISPITGNMMEIPAYELSDALESGARVVSDDEI